MQFCLPHIFSAVNFNMGGAQRLASVILINNIRYYLTALGFSAYSFQQEYHRIKDDYSKFL